MTNYYERHGPANKKTEVKVILRQEMESTNKVKTPDDDCGGRLVHKSTCCHKWGSWLMDLVYINIMLNFWEACKFKASEYMTGLYYVP